MCNACTPILVSVASPVRCRYSKISNIAAGACIPTRNKHAVISEWHFAQYARIERLVCLYLSVLCHIHVCTYRSKCTYK